MSFISVWDSLDLYKLLFFLICFRNNIRIIKIWFEGYCNIEKQYVAIDRGSNSITGQKCHGVELIFFGLIMNFTITL